MREADRVGERRSDPAPPLVAGVQPGGLELAEPRPPRWYSSVAARRDHTTCGVAGTWYRRSEVELHGAQVMNSRAGCSRSARMRWMKAAASAPSTTRWSNDDDRFITWRGTNAPSTEDGAGDDLVDADDGHLGGVDDRRRDDAAERAEAGDRDRRAGQLLQRHLRRAGGLGQAGDLGGGRPQIADVGVLDDRHHQARGRLHGDAEVDRAVALHDTGLVVEPGVHLRVVAHAPPRRRASGTAAPTAVAGRPSFSSLRSSSSAVTSTSSTYVKWGMRRFDACIRSAMLRRRPTTLTSSTSSPPSRATDRRAPRSAAGERAGRRDPRGRPARRARCH